MQPMTEDLIRNVVQQVLSQMGGPGADATAPARGRRRQDGVYPTADAAVAAAEAAYRTFRLRPLADRDKAVKEIKRICVEQAEELGPARSWPRRRSAASTTRSPSSATRSRRSPASSTSAPRTMPATTA